MRRLKKERLKFSRGQRGVSLLETLVALSILSVIGVTFINGLVTVSKANFTADEQTTAESLARSQIEWAKNADYVEEATQYSPAPIPDGGDHVDYSVVITASPLRNPDDGLQRITVTIKHFDKTIIELESYKRQK